MLSPLSHANPVFVARIFDQREHCNGKIYLATQEECVAFHGAVRSQVPRVGLYTEEDKPLLTFSAQQSWIGELILTASETERTLSPLSLPPLAFSGEEACRRWIREFKHDLMEVAERLRYRAPDLLMRMDCELKRQEIGLLIWAAQQGINLLPWGYRTSHQVIDETLLFNDEDF